MPNEPYSDGYLITYDNGYGQTIGQSDIIEHQPTSEWLQTSLNMQHPNTDPTFLAMKVTVAYLVMDSQGEIIDSGITATYQMP